jgi:acetolactate synthase-1/2/3 large subunit
LKVLQALASAIAAEGVDHVFAVMGDANQDIIVELCEKHELKYVHAHHETSAVGMADGYSRFTGKIGLATTTQGPGYTNATTSLVSARLHRSPVLMLAAIPTTRRAWSTSTQWRSSPRRRR